MIKLNLDINLLLNVFMQAQLFLLTIMGKNLRMLVGLELILHIHTHYRNQKDFHQCPFYRKIK